MKTVGIATFHNLFNLGAVLQAYALQHAIASMGHSCQIIDFLRPSRGTAHQMFCMPISKWAVAHNLSVLMTLRSRLEMRAHFKKFRTRHLMTTPDAFPSVESLGSPSLNFDIYVTGSDMVWNPSWLEQTYAPVYYLEFVKSGRRVAYAPSFACDEIPEKYRERVAGYLRRFDFLSCREDSGCAIIKKLIGRDSEHVLDPSLLLSASEYDKVASAVDLDQSCILVYPMHKSDALRDIALKFKKEMSLPIVVIVPVYLDPREYSYADCVVFTSGPSEFLGWVKKAAFVCTNSFHGTAFSIIYRKNFLTIAATLGNTRIKSLLDKLEIGDRQVASADAIKSVGDYLKPMNYEPVSGLLNEEIKKSMAYLKKALS